MRLKSVYRRLLFIFALVFVMSFALNPKPFEPIETPVVGPLWNWLQESRVYLGLDLQGGTQLDYRIDLSEAKARNVDDDVENDVDIIALIEGVKDVIEKRVNSLGVAEANIFLADIGTEKHIIVELPGIDDIEEAKAKVGKVVSLEFKTRKEEADEEEKEVIRRRATDLLVSLQKEADVDLERASEDLVSAGRVEFFEEEEVYKDEVPAAIGDVLENIEVGSFYKEVIEANEGYIYTQNGLVPQEGYSVLRVVAKEATLRKKPVNSKDFEEEVLAVSDSIRMPEDYARLAEVEEGLEETLESLTAGEVSDIVETDSGLFIVKLNELVEPTVEDWKIRASHILLKTQEKETLAVKNPLKEIPDAATDEEKAELEAKNEEIRTGNEGIQAENEALTKRNEEKDALDEITQEKAAKLIQQLRDDPSLFAQLAKDHSEDDGNAADGGDLGYFGPDKMVPPFQEAALDMEIGEISDEPVKTEFGYHIIQVVDKTEPGENLFAYSILRFCYEGASDCDDSSVSKADAQAKATASLKLVREEMSYSLERVWFSALPDPWQETDLDGRYFKKAEVAYDQTTFRPYVSISFDATGAELFEELTGANVNKPIAIFVGGELISAPNVQQKISGGQAQITLGISDPREALLQANELANDLNAGAIPAPLRKPNELNIGASLGQDSLSKSLKAGAIGLLILAVFMILYYRFMGVLAVAALCIYGVFLLFFIQSTIPSALSYTLAGSFWFVLAYVLLHSRLDGWSKFLYLILSMFGIFFVGSVMTNPLVLTLAGVAGVILSIGMAVDANILIFERIKEEFALGRSFLSAVETGFTRAWTSILDSNVSTLITCAILFYFGSSIIRGFALNLALGVVISMFTAVTVTKSFLMIFAGTKLEKIDWLWKK